MRQRWCGAIAATSFLLLAPAPGWAQIAAQGDRPPLRAQATPGAVCPAQVPAALNRITNRLAQVRWSILVQTLGTGASRQTLFAKNAEMQLIPASNHKVLTTAAALVKLGAQSRIRTSVYGDSRPPNLATLRIIGRGDPSLTTAQLNALAQQLSQAGVRRVAQLIGDDTHFRGAAVNPTWDPDDTLAGYGAAVNSLMLNQNAIGLTLFPQRIGQPLRVQWDDPTDRADWQIANRAVTVATSQGEFLEVLRDRTQWLINIDGQLRAGSEPEPVAVSVPNPGNYLVQKFRTALSNARITVDRSTLVKATPAPLGEIELAAVESPPMAQLLIETNRESNNVYAEALLKTTGKAQTPNHLDATTSSTAAVKAILTPLGVNPNRYTMADGSGLSDRNRTSAAALVQTLQAMAQLPTAAVYRDSMAVAGVNGTLKNRFRNTSAQGKVQAKTGTITGVVSLSGYATPQNHPQLTFSILTNSDVSATTVRSAVDEIVLTLMRLRQC
jgi:D-alanyl-D-alanine carboxypeptidase/D-alanyl-D-alanine-endopeptidase (penicillin-binding protein 4)